MPVSIQNRQRTVTIHTAMIKERLQRVITRAYREVSTFAEKEKATLRDAAMLLAVSRVEEATRIRGIYP